VAALDFAVCHEFRVLRIVASRLVRRVNPFGLGGHDANYALSER
jgi:hypothetical protein